MNQAGIVDEVLERVSARNPHMPKLLQAVEEFVRSVFPVCIESPEYLEARVLERLIEPDRVISFRVTWRDDNRNTRINRAWRVQHNNCLGPYKGGLRFRPSVDEDTLRFLGFEQTMKNSLTGLGLGGAKGGSDFDPKGRSPDEVQRFCQSLMAELYRYIGDDIDVPAGDIGVGETEIGYLFGHYMRLTNAWSGALTGKGCEFGGSAGRSSATGYGCIHFCRSMLARAEKDTENLRVAISGSGTVALHAAEKALAEGFSVLTLSDSGGCVYFPDGMTSDQLDEVMSAKQESHCSLREFVEAKGGVEYFDSSKPWLFPCDVAMPCATENELDESDAKALTDNGLTAVCEGANMPCTAGAIEVFRDQGVLFAPSKAANAGGVAVSSMELTQNVTRTSWSRDRVDSELRHIMQGIHDACVENGGKNEDGNVDYVRGANVASFRNVAKALLAYGVI